MNEVTIVCCYNDEQVYNDFVNTLKSQTFGYDLIGIDNRGNKRFTSCAAAYNSVIDEVKTKYVIYSHQDILLQDSDLLSKFVSYLDRIKRDDILGVAGVKLGVKGTLTNINHVNPAGNTIFAGRNRVSLGMIECDTVDECFFGGYTEHFRDESFDEKICDDWHLYAVEACLKTRSKYVSSGGQVYVCDLNLIHRSYGKVNRKFVIDFWRLCKKYREYFPYIVTTCAGSRTKNTIYMICSFSYFISENIMKRTARKILLKIGLYERVKKIIKKE